MKKLLLPALIVLVAALAVVITERVCASRHAEPQIDRLNDVSWLTRALGLSGAQAAEIQKIQIAYSDDLETCCERNCAARDKLSTALFDETDTNAVRELVEEMCHAQRDSDLVTLQHIRKVRELLTPGQQEKYEELVSTCVCGSCPFGGHHESK